MEHHSGPTCFIATLLWLEGDGGVLGRGVNVLRHRGFDVETASTGAIGLALFFKASPDIVILDWSLPDMTGEPVVRAIRAAGSDIPILVTGRFGKEQRDEVLACGANRIERKPIRLTTLLRTIGRLLKGPTPAPTVAIAESTSERNAPLSLRRWTQDVLAILDEYDRTLASEVATLGHAATRRLLGRLARELASPDVTVPQFLAGAGAFRLIEIASPAVGRQVLATTRKTIVSEFPDRLLLHEKVAQAIDGIESAHALAFPLREGVLARDLGIAPAYLGSKLRDETGLGWDAWARGAQLRLTVRALIGGRHPIAQVAADCQWSSRERLHHCFRDLFELSPRVFRLLGALAAAPIHIPATAIRENNHSASKREVNMLAGAESVASSPLRGKQ